MLEIDAAKADGRWAAAYESQKAAVSLSERIRKHGSDIGIRTDYTLPPIREDLDPTIYLSGTSGAQRPVWMTKIQEITHSYGVDIDDSYRDDWDSVVAADEELMHKLGNAVHLIAITNETDSFGALAELGPRLMYGDLAGQSLGVYIETPTSGSSSASRTRLLARAHLDRLREDFPNLPVFVADDLQQLAIFGLSEHYRQKQRMHR